MVPLNDRDIPSNQAGHIRGQPTQQNQQVLQAQQPPQQQNASSLPEAAQQPAGSHQGNTQYRQSSTVQYRHGIIYRGNRNHQERRGGNYPYMR